MFETIPITVPDSLRLVNQTANDHGSFVAGGCVRSIWAGEKVRDVDIFSVGIEAHLSTVFALKEIGFVEVFSNPMLTRLKLEYVMDVDVVKPRIGEFIRTQGTPEEVISHFDFTVARAALLNNEEALVDLDFMKDCEDKRLHIKHIVCPLSQVKRIAKYSAKGYKISLTETLKLFSTYRERNNEELEGLLQRQDLSAEELAELMQWVYVD